MPRRRWSRPALAFRRKLYYIVVMRVRQKQSTTISVRLSQDEESSVRGLARRQKSSVSDVIRDAVSDFVRHGKQRPPRPYDEIADLIGSVTGLPPDLSDSTGDRFAEIVRQKAARGR
jgi:hypothetical protein